MFTNTEKQLIIKELRDVQDKLINPEYDDVRTAIHFVMHDLESIWKQNSTGYRSKLTKYFRSHDNQTQEVKR